MSSLKVPFLLHSRSRSFDYRLVFHTGRRDLDRRFEEFTGALLNGALETRMQSMPVAAFFPMLDALVLLIAQLSDRPDNRGRNISDTMAIVLPRSEELRYDHLPALLDDLLSFGIPHVASLPNDDVNPSRQQVFFEANLRPEVAKVQGELPFGQSRTSMQQGGLCMIFPRDASFRSLATHLAGRTIDSGPVISLATGVTFQETSLLGPRLVAAFDVEQGGIQLRDSKGASVDIAQSKALPGSKLLVSNSRQENGYWGALPAPATSQPEQLKVQQQVSEETNHNKIPPMTSGVAKLAVQHARELEGKRGILDGLLRGRPLLDLQSSIQQARFLVLTASLPSPIPQLWESLFHDLLAVFSEQNDAGLRADLVSVVVQRIEILHKISLRHSQDRPSEWIEGFNTAVESLIAVFRGSSGDRVLQR